MQSFRHLLAMASVVGRATGMADEKVGVQYNLQRKAEDKWLLGVSRHAGEEGMEFRRKIAAHDLT